MVAATGHNGSFRVAEPATCTEDGYEDYYCQTCGEVYTIVLPAPGHTWTEGGLVPYCTVCNYGRTGDPAFWSLRNTDLVSSVEETYSYVYNGSLLTQMTKDSTSLLFVYDAFGTPSELRYNNVYYHYVINLQGDVIAILDEYGAVVVEYTYDAWGNILTVTGSLASTLGKLNPLTYRGYVYDWETGLYYLQSRYYNPEWGRFINADAFVSTGQGFVGNNMFAYCLNNPTNLVDPTGELAFPGEIHNEVVRRIAAKYNLYTEQFIIYTGGGWGRADLVGADGQVWDVKRDKTYHINAGEKQVRKYIDGTWFRKGETKLKVGTTHIESDYFYYKSGLTTYKVTYRDAGNGVIAYDYTPVDFDYQTVLNTMATIIAAAAAGAMSGLFGYLTGGYAPIF